MASSCKVICALIVAGCFNYIATENAEDNQLVRGIARPVGRAYSLVMCDYRFEAGYTCKSCHRALHCYPGNAAIQVDCYGLWRFCRDGRCSMHQGAKCPDAPESLITHHANDTIAVASATEAFQIASEVPEAASALPEAVIALSEAVSELPELASRGKEEKVQSHVR